MMNFGGLNWLDSFIKKLKTSIGLNHPRDLHLWYCTLCSQPRMLVFHLVWKTITLKVSQQMKIRKGEVSRLIRYTTQDDHVHCTAWPSPQILFEMNCCSQSLIMVLWCANAPSCTHHVLDTAPNVLTMAKDYYVMVMLNYCVPNTIWWDERIWGEDLDQRLRLSWLGKLSIRIRAAKDGSNADGFSNHSNKSTWLDCNLCLESQTQSCICWACVT